MDRNLLEEKQRELENRFTELNKQKAEHEKSASDIEAELFRLQGDFRTVQDLLGKLPVEDVEIDPATTITAEEDTLKDAKPTKS